MATDNGKGADLLKKRLAADFITMLTEVKLACNKEGASFDSHSPTVFRGKLF